MQNKRRVVVTGLGMVTPLGTGVDKNWQAVIAGKSGIGPLTHFNPSQLKCHVAGEVRDFRPLDFMDSRSVDRFDPFIQFALAASRMAVEDSGIQGKMADPERCGVIVGTAVGAHTYFKPVYRTVEQEQLNKIPPFMIINAAGNIVAGVIAIEFGCRGPHHCLMDACASGTNAVGVAFRAIRNGDADVMIAGGAEAPVVESLTASLDSLGALTSKRNKEPEKASRPFDGDRDGFASSEGSGMLVLELLEHALERGAGIYGEILGYGNNCDAYHYTAPSVNGMVAARCMQLALADAVTIPEQVDYINAHGTSTLLNDFNETRAIKSVFNGHLEKLAVSSTKSMTGHMWGAAGSVEAIYTLLTIRDSIMPPTINHEFPDPECTLDYIPNTARKANVKIALSNSFGFGGINGSLVIGAIQNTP
jgi:3-oxoacyl-[acyl-carrier-protein] synthase II